MKTDKMKKGIAPVVYLTLLTGCFSKQTESSPPNIVFILADDLGWNDVGFHGSNQIPTPNIDALAMDGVQLANYYVHPLCTPTRTALLTGRYPTRVGLQHGVIVSAQPYGLPLNETLLPEYLKHMGYATHIVGKWHLGFYAREFTPLRRGFDSHYGFYQGCGDYYDHTYATDVTQLKTWGLDFRRNDDVNYNAFGQYSTELFTGEAERIIRNHSLHSPSKPLFLYLAQQAVHSGLGGTVRPLEAPQKYIDRMSHIKNHVRRTYAAMVSALDDSVGNVTRALHEAGLLENTVIIFSTDNGGPANGYDYNDANNWPLRGMKNTLWDGGVRGAGLVWSPLLRKRGYISTQLMHVTDWLPTILHLSGYNKSQHVELDGFNQWETISSDKASPRNEVLHNYDPKNEAYGLLVGDLKLLHDKRGETKRLNRRYRPDGMEHFTNFGLETLVSQNNVESINNTSKALNFRSVWKNYWQMSFGHERGLNARYFSQENNVNVDFNQNNVLGRDTGVSAESNGVAAEILAQYGQQVNRISRRPFVVKCNEPENRTKCRPNIKPCLFNITADPCEFNDLADKRPRELSALLTRLEHYKALSAAPINKPVDEQGLPVHHNRLWVPWVRLSHMAST